jgi:hypothetical protein
MIKQIHEDIGDETDSMSQNTVSSVSSEASKKYVKHLTANKQLLKLMFGQVIGYVSLNLCNNCVQNFHDIGGV